MSSISFGRQVRLAVLDLVAAAGRRPVVPSLSPKFLGFFRSVSASCGRGLCANVGMVAAVSSSRFPWSLSNMLVSMAFGLASLAPKCAKLHLSVLTSHVIESLSKLKH